MLPKTPAPTLRRARVPGAAALPVVLVAALAVLAGCGGQKDDGGALLATVGETEIRADYYEDRLARLEENELPRGEDGEVLDMSTREGKEAFLTTLINKELMVQKGEQLGYIDDPRIAHARESLTAYEAGLAMWRDIIGEPANELSNEEVDAFYAQLGKQRKIRYIIANHEADAAAARAMALDGADWEDVADRYHDGAIPDDGRLQMVIPYGRFSTEFENPIFGTEIGGVTEPFLTEYGWWVARIEGEKETGKPAKEEALARILDLTRNRKIAGLRKDFREKVHDRYRLVVHDEALEKAWQGLPEREAVIDPVTNEPVPREQLKPLDVEPRDLDLPFYSYVLDGEPREFTLGDYKNKFDQMNTFQRPKKSSMMGGMRAHIINDLERALLDAEAKRLGFYEDPEVRTKVAVKVEEMIVTSLYNDVVTYDERVTPEQLEAFWAEHASEFDRPQTRSGRVVVAADEAKAAEARAELADGASWREVINRYGTDPNNRQQGGVLADVTPEMSGPVKDALYALEPGELSEPFPVGDGRFAVVELETVDPGGPVEMVEASQAAGQRIKQLRKEEAFQALLDEWKAEFGVVRHDENLDQVKSWKELTHVEAPGPEVPRS